MKSKVAGPTLRAEAAYHRGRRPGNKSRPGGQTFGVILVAAGMAAGSLTALGNAASAAASASPIEVPAFGGAATAARPASPIEASAFGNYGPTGPVPAVGTRIRGGTAYFAEGPGTAPGFIFPFYDPQDCTPVNIGQLVQLMYRPLYWYGNDNSPTIDYSYSVGQPPVFSDGNTTVTVTLNSYRWSDGEQVTSRDVEFWMNMMFAERTHWCGYLPGYFPDNVASVSYPNSATFVLHLKQAYNPTWFTYNELSQITPLPIAWDRTSLSGRAPRPTAAHLPDTTARGIAAVYKFLYGLAKNTATYAKSPIWSVVDGPWDLKSISAAGEVTYVPNPDYSGSPKPSLSSLVLVPFTSDEALLNVIKLGGPNALEVADLGDEYLPQLKSVEAEGYTATNFAPSEISYFPLNLHNPKFGALFSQTYFRQALAHLVDQQGWIIHLMDGYAAPTYGPVPSAPPNSLADSEESADPYPFSLSDAANILKTHGWANVAPGKTAYCAKPGTRRGECGAGVVKGLKIAFNLDAESGATVTDEEVQDLKNQAAQVGIVLDLTEHTWAQVAGAAVDCGPGGSARPGAAQCNWTAEDWGAGWIFLPDYLPTGEPIFYTGSAADYEGWSDARTNALIAATITAPASQSQAALDAYENYIIQQVPVVFIPTATGDPVPASVQLTSQHLGGYSNNLFALLTPENWYLTK
jgi:peptide/nickel transport system substrate-binding protein